MSSGGLAGPSENAGLRKLTGLVGGLVGVGLVGLLDWQTGNQVSISIFYLLPIGLAVWYSGRFAGIIVSGVAAAAWLWFDVQGGNSLPPFLRLWNALVRLGFFLLTTLLLGRLRLLTHHLEIVVRERTAELAAEVGRCQEAESRMHLQSSALEAAANAIVITDRAGNLIWANPAFTQLTGYSVAEARGQNVRFLKSGKHDQSFYQNLWQTILAGHVWQAEMVNRRKDGSLYPEENTITPVRNQQGEITHFIAVKRDLTARKRAEFQLTTLAHAVESTSEPIGITDLQGRFIFVNRAFQQVYGYAEPDILGQTVDVVYSAANPPESLAEILAQTRVAGWRGEVVGRRKDGTDVPVFVSTSRINSKTGEPIGLMAVAQDVTERKHAESLLRESERKLRLIAENATDAIFAFDMNRQPLYANPAVEQLTGYTFAEIQEKKFINWIHPDDQERMLKHWEALYTGRGYAEEEFRLITKAGNTRWCSSTWGPLRDENGRQIGVQGRERDVTELRRAQAATLRLATIVESSQDAILSASPDGRIVSWNKAAERMLGYRAEELLGQSVGLLAPPDRVAEQQKLLRNLLAGKTVESFETVRRRKDGSLIHVFITASTMCDTSGNIAGLSAIMHDFTERKRLEREVLEISTRERRHLGHELHDGLGQYLAGIAFRAKALEQTLASAGDPHAAEAKEITSLLSNAIEQARSLARGLDPIGIESIGLITALQLLAAETEAVFQVACRFHCSDSALRLTTLRVDPRTALALYRIAQEAIHNAITHGEVRQITIELAMDTDHLCLRIKDDGTGFEIERPNPTGMGLRVMRYRAGSIGADLIINSQLKQGTEISCRVPRAACFPAMEKDAGARG